MTVTITSIRSGRRDRVATPVTAFLGTGRMGGPMAANLAISGFDVWVWNRTGSRAEALPADARSWRAARRKPSGAPRSSSPRWPTGPTEQAATGLDGLLILNRYPILAGRSHHGTAF
jgi:3-hydroxyisobutyrate dehydrogenase